MDLDLQLQDFISFVECSLALLSELRFFHLHGVPDKLGHMYDGPNRFMCLHGGSNESMGCGNPQPMDNTKPMDNTSMMYKNEPQPMDNTSMMYKTNPYTKNNNANKLIIAKNFK